MNRFGEIACTRASTLVGDDILDVSLQLLDGERLVRNQYVKLRLVFTSVRFFTNLGLVIRIFDQLGRCAFAKHFVDLDESEICRQLEPGRHVFVVHFSAALPVGWYAVTFSLAENPSGDFQQGEAWIAVTEQTCYVAFNVGDVTALPGQGYCNLPVHSYLALPGSMDAVVEQTGSFPEFPWFVNEPRYSVVQIVSALRELIPDLNLEQNVAGELVLNPGCCTLELPATHPRFHTQVGQRSDHGVASTGEAGALLYGPYIHARPGRYTATFFGAGKPQPSASAMVDVVARKGAHLLGNIQLQLKDGMAEWKVPFVVPEPGVHDLEFRVFVDQGVDLEISKLDVVSEEQLEFLSLLRAVVNSESSLTNTPSCHVNSESDTHHISQSMQWLKKQSSVSAVYCPSISWLPLLMALCDVIEEAGEIAVLVVPNGFEKIRSDAIRREIVEFSEFVSQSGWLNCNSIVTHCFGWAEEVNCLIRQFPSAKLELYADSFTNAETRHDDKVIFLNGLKEISRIYYFDWVPDIRFYKEIDFKVVPSIAFFESCRVLSEKYILSSPDLSFDLDGYVVFYVRYWGVGYYNGFSGGNISNAIFNTLINCGVGLKTVVIKSDPRVKQSIYDGIVQYLCSNGVNVMLFADYIRRFGLDSDLALLPVEFFIAKGLLCNASAHFVMDSSLGYIIGSHPNIRRPSSVVFGVDQESINEWPRCVGVAWVEDQVHLYANRLIRSASAQPVSESGSPNLMPRAITLLK